MKFKYRVEWIVWEIQTKISYILYKLSLPSTKAFVKDCIIGLLMLIFMFVFWNGLFGKIAGSSGAVLAIGNIVIFLVFGLGSMIISIFEYEQGFYDRYNKKI